MLTPVPMLCSHNICFLATPLGQPRHDNTEIEALECECDGPSRDVREKFPFSCQFRI